MNVSPLVIGVMRLGSWGARFTTSEYQTFIKGCLDLGLDTFDHADIYGGYTTEEEFGAVLRKDTSLRRRMKLITKCGIKMVSPNRPEHRIKSYDFGKQHIIKSVENSLRNLNTDYLDVLLLHRPDYLMEPLKVAEVFKQLKEEGKVLAFGVSNFTTTQFALLHDHFPLVTNQVEVSLLQRAAFEDGTLDQCYRHGLNAMAWSPLGGGALFNSNPGDTTLESIQTAAQPLCEKYDCALDQLLYAWLLRHPSNIIPVLGTSNIDRVTQAKLSLEIQLKRDDWYTLWTAATGSEVP